MARRKKLKIPALNIRVVVIALFVLIIVLGGCFLFDKFILRSDTFRVTLAME